MTDTTDGTKRVVRAVHGVREVTPDPPEEIEQSEELRRTRSPEELLEVYSRVLFRDSHQGAHERRVLLRAMCRSFGNGVRVGLGVLVLHPGTFEIGDAVFIGNQSFLQGRHDGRCVIGAHTWIGPQSYFDCRDMELGEHVGWGPGAKVLGSEHTGEPADVPIIQTDLVIRPVRVGKWADIGTGVVLLPGVTVGEGAVVAGVPARVIRTRLAGRE